MASKEIYIEELPDGRYAVRRRNSQRAGAVCDTQRDAIKRAKELVPSVHPDVERIAKPPAAPNPTGAAPADENPRNSILLAAGVAER